MLALEEGSKSAHACLARELRSEAHTGDVGVEPFHELLGKVRTSAVATEHGAQEATPLLRGHVLIEIQPPADRFRQRALVEGALKQRRHTRRRALEEEGGGAVPA